jgi:hypothetical protein
MVKGLMGVDACWGCRSGDEISESGRKGGEREHERILEDEHGYGQRRDKARFGEGNAEGIQRVDLEHNWIMIRIQLG